MHSSPYRPSYFSVMAVASNEDFEKCLKDFKDKIRGSLIHAGNDGVWMDKLMSMYKNDWNEEVPVRKLGFRSPLELFTYVDDTVQIKPSIKDKFSIVIVPDKKTGHVTELVNLTTKKNNNKKKAGSTSSRGGPSRGRGGSTYGNSRFNNKSANYQTSYSSNQYQNGRQSSSSNPYNYDAYLNNGRQSHQSWSSAAEPGRGNRYQSGSQQRSSNYGSSASGSYGNSSYGSQNGYSEASPYPQRPASRSYGYNGSRDDYGGSSSSLRNDYGIYDKNNTNNKNNRQGYPTDYFDTAETDRSVMTSEIRPVRCCDCSQSEVSATHIRLISSTTISRLLTTLQRTDGTKTKKSASITATTKRTNGSSTSSRSTRRSGRLGRLRPANAPRTPPGLETKAPPPGIPAPRTPPGLPSKKSMSSPPGLEPKKQPADQQDQDDFTLVERGGSEAKMAMVEADDVCGAPFEVIVEYRSCKSPAGAPSDGAMILTVCFQLGAPCCKQ
ncbi:hypothetical protein L596_016793 [Steinernema carpocapsae]|uniref:HTH OST-type domain-containing protein n=1 Tax=Steinernema carpocapsae TaxID=34508 RepID=A0A4U5NK93_STECR|nr:hypothetical protein L596_016793 [Steinernema carpocapsae]